MVKELYEQENGALIDLAKKGAYTVQQLEQMPIGEYYGYLAKELKDSSEIIKKYGNG